MSMAQRNSLIRQTIENNLQVSQLGANVLVHLATSSTRAPVRNSNDDSDDETVFYGQRGPNVRRGHSSWIRDYVDNDPIYPEHFLVRRFGVTRDMFHYIHNYFVRTYPEFWGTRTNGLGRIGHPSQVKILVCLRILVTSGSYDSFDDQARMSSTSIRDYFQSFVKIMVTDFGPLFLNRPMTNEELDNVSEQFAELGFPGCVGSIDCMKLIWKNCPSEENGQYHNPKSGKLATIQCEGWCDHDRYIWHWFAGRPGTNNDLNVMAHSPLFQKIFNNRLPFISPSGFSVVPNRPKHFVRYLLGDGIYPRWPLFVIPIPDSEVKREQRFSGLQECFRKSIECCFGILQGRFSITRKENFRWELDEVVRISNCCVILHNMWIRIRQYRRDDPSISRLGLDGIIANERIYSDRATAEYNQRFRLQQMTQSENFGDVVDNLIIRDSLLTNEKEHNRLMDDLVDLNVI